MQLQLEIIINSLEDGIICLDDSGHLAFLNLAAARLFECDGCKLVGHPAALSPHLAMFLDHLKLQEMHLSLESPKGSRRVQGRKTDGQAYSLEALVTRLEDGGKLFYVIDIRDISAQERMEKAFFQSRKSQAISALTSGIAHDFNNVLTGIISHLELAAASPELTAALKENLEHARHSARRGADLVHKLQGFSRQSKSKLEPVDLPGLLQQVVSTLRRDLEPRIQVRSTAPAVKPWPVHADAGQLVQFLMNIALSARDALQDGGELLFELANVTLTASETHPARKSGEFVRFTLTATPCGISPEGLSGFFELEPPNNDLGENSGTSITRTTDILRDYGGWVEIQNGASRATRLHVLLPRAQELAEPPRPRVPVLPHSSHAEGKESILIVDDEELVRMVIRAVLGYRGYQIIEAANAEEALQKYFEPASKFDLILMDNYMPGMSGRDALIRIRRWNPAAKAILLSATQPDPEIAPELRDLKFLQKPFENQELVRLVRQTLETGIVVQS